MPSWQLEQILWQAGYSPLAGLDEAGRGALAGPVVVGVVILPYKQNYPFKDSKQISSKARISLAQEVKSCALAWKIGIASAAEVDKFNVLNATYLAAKRALAKLIESIVIKGLITDYLKLETTFPLIGVPKADQISFQVAAASILAKTERDSIMLAASTRYPHYNFAKHKGYGTKDHIDSLYNFGPCDLHRRTFAPVAKALNQPKLL